MSESIPSLGELIDRFNTAKGSVFIVFDPHERSLNATDIDLGIKFVGRLYRYAEALHATINLETGGDHFQEFLRLYQGLSEIPVSDIEITGLGQYNPFWARLLKKGASGQEVEYQAKVLGLAAAILALLAAAVTVVGGVETAIINRETARLNYQAAEQKLQPLRDSANFVFGQLDPNGATKVVFRLEEECKSFVQQCVLSKATITITPADTPTAEASVTQTKKILTATDSTAEQGHPLPPSPTATPHPRLKHRN